MKQINQCDLCKSKEFDVFLTQDTENLKYLKLINPNIDSLKRVWLRCKKCSLVSQSPRLEKHEIDLIYKNNRSLDFRNQESPEEYFDKITKLPDNESENYARVQRFKKHINSKHENILDIGCGGGVFLYTFSKYFEKFKLYGIEASPQFAKLARSKLDIEIYNSFFDGNEFNFKPDIITILHVFEHIPDPNTFLEKIYDMMSKNSLLIIEVPHINDFNTLDKSHMRFSPPHIFFYSETTLQKILLRHNLKIIDFEIFTSIRKRNNITVYIKRIEN